VFILLVLGRRLWRERNCRDREKEEEEEEEEETLSALRGTALLILLLLSSSSPQQFSQFPKQHRSHSPSTSYP
jgi:hypothetical protein